jgi:hypothetical protein
MNELTKRKERNGGKERGRGNVYVGLGAKVSLHGVEARAARLFVDKVGDVFDHLEGAAELAVVGVVRRRVLDQLLQQ